MASHTTKKNSARDGFRSLPLTSDYRRLLRELAGIGYIIKGSVQIRRTVCGKSSCHCRKGARFRHGPYYWWTSKIAGKTVTCILPKEEGELYILWARNRQKLEAVVEQMLRLSARVASKASIDPPPWFRFK
jgi:hypothetical protein